MILWGMGISQHVHGTDNARCLIALVADDRPDRPARHRPASAARPEQRAGRDRCGPDPDDVPRLPARRQRRGARALREVLGHATLDDKPGLTVVEIMHKALAPTRSAQDPRHVHHGREPGDVRPGREPRARGAGRARAPGGAGHLPDRDRVPGRRGPAGQRLPREDRHLHQHRPHGAAGPAGARPAGRRDARTCGSSSRSRSAWACDWNYDGDECGVAAVFDEMRQAMPQHRRHHLGAAASASRASPTRA